MAKPAAKEWNNLQSLSKEEKHPHLMVALSAYLHGDKFFILQEEAEQSLHDYLKGEGDRFKSADLWEQMSGVSDGLATLHQLYKGTKIAYHQDLKPANILIVKRVFKIADFGLLEFKPVSLLDDTGSTGVPNAHNTGYYAAPRQGKYTRDSDIWSLGCIMSELATCDIQGRDGVKSYREARIANGPSGRDTPRFFCGQVVKTVVLERHRLLYDCVQSKALTEEDTASLQFQKDFYSKEFFDLLNSMFKNMHSITNLLEVSSILTVPDADRIASTTERLRKAALPALALNNQIENLNLEQRMIDLEALNTSFGAHVTNFKKALNRRNKLRFPATTLVDLKQYIVNLQAKQHAQRRQQGLSSLKPFLERFEQLGELTKGLPKTIEFMGFVWVRFPLSSPRTLF
jgi:serine/threonine protein kinase